MAEVEAEYAFGRRKQNAWEFVSTYLTRLAGSTAEGLTRGARGEKRARLAPVFFFLVLLPHGTEEAGEGASPATGRPVAAVSGEGDATRGLGSPRRLHSERKRAPGRARVAATRDTRGTARRRPNKVAAA